MIREEAVTVLKAFMENPLFSEVHKAAFNIAIHDIKAYQDWNINNLILVNKDDYEPLEQEPTSKNSLEVDCISKQEVIDLMMQKWGENFSGDDAMQESIDAIREMPSVTPQEPKPMVEIDLYSVIKQKYIEREVLDKLRAEIETKYGQCDICEYITDYDGFYHQIGDIADILEIIDKYKAESEDNNGTD